MICNSLIQFDRDRAQTYFDKLLSSKAGKTFEIKAINKRRTVSQNSYLHLILTWYAIEYGERVQYIKQEVFKKQVNAEIFFEQYMNPKTAEVRDSWRSSSDLSSSELTTAIDRFRNYSVLEAGIYLPSPEDLKRINEMELQIKRFESQFL